MDRMNVISPAPHISASERTRGVAVDEIIALFPAVLLGIMQYGLRALIIFAIAALSALVLTVILHVAFHKRLSSADIMYSVGAGILSSFFLGSGCSLWLPAVSGAVTALAIFYLPRRGGIVFHPALVAAAFIMLTFPVQASRVCEPIEGLKGFFTLSVKNLAFSSASAAHLVQGYSVNIWDLIIGGIAGTIGLTGSMPLIVGGCYLMLRRISLADAPFAAGISMFVLALLFPGGENAVRYALGMILSGTFVFGAMFFLYPAAGAPVSRHGRTLYGVAYGVVNFMMRRLFNVDGTVTSLLLLQAFSWDFDLYVRPVAVRVCGFISDIFAFIAGKFHSFTRKASRSGASRKAVKAKRPPKAEAVTEPAPVQNEDTSSEDAEEAPTEAIKEEDNGNL